MAILQRQCAQGQFVKVSAAAELAGVSTSCIRLWSNKGHLEFRRTIGGQRQVFLPSLRRLVGLDESDESNEENMVEKICLYLRVSSREQRRDGNLDRQKTRMILWANQTYGVSEEDLLIVQDCASAFGARRGLQQIVDKMIDGKISKVCFEFEDRFSRTSSEKRLLEHIASRFGVELIAVKQIMETDEQSYFVRELVDYITVVANRISGSKAANTKRIIVPDDVKKKAFHYYQQGYTLSGIVDQLKDEGVISEKTGEHFKANIIRKAIEENLKTKELTNGEKPQIQNHTLDAFIREKCILSSDHKVFADPLFTEYTSFVLTRGEKPLNRNVYGALLKQKGLRRVKSTKGYRAWKGISLKNDPGASVRSKFK